MNNIILQLKLSDDYISLEKTSSCNHIFGRLKQNRQSNTYESLFLFVRGGYYY